MSVDPDTERLERLRQLQEEREKRARHTQAAAKKVSLRDHEAALLRAKSVDFADLRALRFLYCAGVDRSGAPVIVYHGANLPMDTMDLDRVALFIVQTMEAFVESKHSVLYIHSGGATGENQPNAAWLKRLFGLFASKQHANLGFFYVLEPTIWLKLLVFVSKGFLGSDFYRKIVYLATPQEIDNIADALALPPHIYTKSAEAEGGNQADDKTDTEASSQASRGGASEQHEQHEAVL